MPRPKKKAAESHNFRLPTVQCTASELATIQARAAAAGMTQSAYIRAMALSGRVIVKESRLDYALIEQLRRIGVNLNQLTRIARSAGAVPAALAALLARIEQLLDEAMLP